MKRTYAAVILATAVALPLGACGGDDSGGGYYYGGSGSGGAAGCGQYTTCGTCTPVVGCGWCFNSTGGVCTTDPNECAQVTSEFTWTWDPPGCPDVDASVAPADAAHATDAGIVRRPDAAAPDSDTGATPEDAQPPSSDAGTTPDDAAISPGDAGSSSGDAGGD
jgi:hypothetical protein